MRKISLSISELGLSIGDEITIQLIDSVGCVLKSAFIENKTYAITNDVFETELLENDKIKVLSSYEITLPSSLSFYFKIPTNNENTPHELTSLLSLACYENIIDKKHNKLYDDFVVKLDKYFSHEYVRLNTTELSVIKLYEYYANNILHGANTIDIMKLMDEYLSTIGK